MTKLPQRDKWIAGELPDRGPSRARQGQKLSTVLIERLERAQKKHLIGRTLSSVLRDERGRRKGGVRPVPALLAALGVASSVAGVLFGSVAVGGAAGCVMLMAGAALWWRERNASHPSGPDYINELQNEAARFDDYIDSISVRLPKAAVAELAKIKQTLGRVIAALDSWDHSALGIPAEEAFFAHELVARYLPDACHHYIDAMDASSGNARLEDGRTAEDSLLRQLGILEGRLKRTLTKVAAAKTQALANHEAFVRTKE